MQATITGIVMGLVLAVGAVGGTYALGAMGEEDCFEAASSTASGMEPAAVVEAGSGGDCRHWVKFDCDPEAPTVEAGSDADGLVRFRVDNTGRATEALFCLIDGGDIKRAGVEQTLPAGEVTNVDLRVPAGTYMAAVGIADGSGTSAVFVDPGDCADKAYRVDVTTHVGTMGKISTSVNSGSCFDQKASAQEAAVPGSIPDGPGGDGASPTTAAAAIAVGGLAGLALLVYRWPTVKYAAMGLFTRLTKPRILDHGVRAQIQDVVTSDPGINANAVARRLELAGGQTRYHLGVLRREGLVTLVRLDGSRHYFPTGRYPPDRMRAIAALRSPSARRIYETIRQEPGRSVKGTAAAARVAPSTVIRVAGRLARVGLVRRRREGRTVRLEPVEST